MRMWKHISPKQLWQTVSCAEIFSSSKSNQLHFPDPGVPPIKILRWLGQTDGVFVAFRQMLLNSKIDECFHIYKWSFSGGPTTINFPISKWTFFQGMYSPFRTEIKDPGLDSSQNINYGSIWKAFETAKHFFYCHPFIHSVVSTMSGFLGGESTTWIPEMVLVPPSSTRFPNRPLVSSGQWWPACRALIGREPPLSGFWLVRPVVCWSGLTTRRSPLVSSDQPAGQTCPPETFPNHHYHHHRHHPVHNLSHSIFSFLSVSSSPLFATSEIFTHSDRVSGLFFGIIISYFFFRSSLFTHIIFLIYFSFLVFALWFSSFYAQVPTSICLLALCPIFSLGKDEAQGVSGNLPPDWSLSLYYSPKLYANKNCSPKCYLSELKAKNYWNAQEWGWNVHDCNCETSCCYKWSL